MAHQRHMPSRLGRLVDVPSSPTRRPYLRPRRRRAQAHHIPVTRHRAGWCASARGGLGTLLTDFFVRRQLFHETHTGHEPPEGLMAR
jgi:hypothetical protein